MSASLGVIRGAGVLAGFFSSAPVETALAVGGLVAFVTGVVGVFTVTRGQSFAGHALADLGAVGGSAAFLLGVSQLAGFIAAGVMAAILMELIGVERLKGRDVATGIVFGLGLGLTALFLYLDTFLAGSSNAAVSVLFGSLFVLAPGIVPPVLALAVATMAIILATSRWLLMDALGAELARVRGVPVRLAGAAFLVALALAVELSSLSIGAILSTALLIGPAAAALRLTPRFGLAAVLSGALGTACTWAGIAVSYDSYGWFGAHHNWPVSFCIVALVVLVFLAAGPLGALLGRRARRPAPAPLVADPVR